jgi:sigma-B regulation protein RsbU (phosphoserine phosphatase)
LKFLALGNFCHSRRLLFRIVWLVLACAAPVVIAQSFDATHLLVPTDLNAPWLVHAGDDPAYARPGFDDSQWMHFDAHADIKTIFKSSHPDLVWYRMHMKVSPDQTGLALREFKLSSAFEVYVNGERILVSGELEPFTPYTASARLRARIPDRALATGSMVIALRVHISPPEWGVQDPGLAGGNLAIGQEATLYRDDWLSVLGENLMDWLDRLLSVCLGLVALVLLPRSGATPNTCGLQPPAASLCSSCRSRSSPTSPTFRSIGRSLPPCYASPPLTFSPPFFFSFVHQRLGWRWRIFLIFAGIMNAYSGLQGNPLHRASSPSGAQQSPSRRPVFRHPPHRAGGPLAPRQSRSRHPAHSHRSAQSLHLCRNQPGYCSFRSPPGTTLRCAD